MEETMRTKTFTLSLSLILLALLIGACTTAQAAPLTQEGEPAAVNRNITVNGTGVITLSPDLARISIGVQTQDADANRAVADNSDQAQEVVDTLLDFGIEQEDIRTTDFSIFPRQDFDREGQPLEISYVVNNTVRVTVRDLEQVGGVLDAVVQAGANNITGIQFDVADNSAAQADALQAAVLNARARAEALAEAAEVELGQVQSINSFVGGGPAPFVSRSFDVAEAAMDVPISPGQMDITVEVTVVYEIQ
jgi:uncharacterized protein YggE